MRQITLSYIIPAFNEEHHLPKLIESIKRHNPEAYTYEIIVADHASQDDTAKLAHQLNARVVTSTGGTVAGLRNLAARQARGDVYIFLDADIVLTDAWHDHFPETYELLSRQPATVTGSLCGIPDDASFIERYWFAPMQAKTIRYINSGHLITSRILFECINGFDAHLQTGEDVDFSARARNAGAVIAHNPKLRVIHNGYPSTLSAFMRREIWHGKGDCQGLKNILASRVALAAMLFVLLHLIVIAGVLSANGTVSAVAGFFGIVCLCLGSSIFKHKQRSLAGIGVTTLLYYFYFSARAISCIQTLLVPAPTKRQR